MVLNGWFTLSRLVRVSLSSGGCCQIYSYTRQCSRYMNVLGKGAPKGVQRSVRSESEPVQIVSYGIRRYFSTNTGRNNSDKRRDPLAMTAPPPSRSGAERISFGGYALLIIPMATFCLGVWQVYRWRWKLDLIESMEQKTSTVLPFTSLKLENLDHYEYNTVIVRGSFLPGQQLLLGPRSFHDPVGGKHSEGGGGLISGGSQSGYNVITPFKVAGQDTILLVNRGWIPNKNISRFQIDPSNDEEVEISGVVRKGEKRSQFMSKTQPGSMFWLYRDVESMAALLGTSEIFLDLSSIKQEKGEGKGATFTSPSSSSKYQIPIPGQTRVTLRNEHVSYFVTWFSLSAITSYLWIRRFKQRLPLK